MKLRYYLRGLGIGIIVTAIVMSIVFSDKQGMTDEEIKARAAELGMIENTVLAPNQTPTPTAGAAADGQGQSGIMTPSEPDSLEETTAVPTEGASQTVTPASEETSARAATAAPSPTAAVTAAQSLTTTPTMAPSPTATPTAAPSSTAAATAVPSPTAAATSAPSPTAAPTAVPSPTATPTAVPSPTVTPAQAKGNVTITVSSGESSGSVSLKAAQAGLVENAVDFDNYLIANGYDKKLAVGSHVIPVGATYEEIAMQLVSRGN